MARRLSITEKGKGIANDPPEPPRKARVRIDDPEDSTFLHRHSLTLIGRVTNPSAQKVGSLIPFFTDLWKTEIRPIGADLGQGMFQFQFELESDLIAVLEQRPFHYGRWMIILQRWEPTLSPSFPSLIPFWIKVQGIPIHLWTEKITRRIGEDIGVVETIDMTSLYVRMRVHINGRLPLITQSTIEFASGNEIPVRLIYEKLERHCSMCFRLDHELRDCLEAKAQKRAQRLLEEGDTAPKPIHNEQSRAVIPDPRASSNFHFTATRNKEHENYKRAPPSVPRSRYQVRNLTSGYQQRHNQERDRRGSHAHYNPRQQDY